MGRIISDKQVDRLRAGTLPRAKRNLRDTDGDGARATMLSEPVGNARGGGSLIARRSTAGSVAWFYRYLRADNERVTLPLGGYPEISIAKAREMARAESLRHQVDSSYDPRREQEAADTAAAAQEAGTLRLLIGAYVEHLQARGKQSADDVRRLMAAHVVEAFPKLADKPAATITKTDIVDILRRLIADGKGRTAAKLRSYLHAAYQTALLADSDASMPATFTKFGITANPVAATAALSKFNGTRDRVLSDAELRDYIKAVREIKDAPDRTALLLSLYLGGQRPSQLVRAVRSDVDLDRKTITIYDPKGRRTQARPHVLPLTPTVLSIVRERIADGMPAGAPLFPGVHMGGNGALSAHVRQIAEGDDPYQLRDVRRTAETRLAGLGVTKDVRAQLLSHGIGGVQDVSYDRHDYMPEKREALAKWEKHLATVARKKVRHG